MITLESYLCGRWQAGKAPFVTLVDPTHEQPVAQASSEGLDLAAAVEYGRKQGGAALRALTFAQRGELLKALSAALHERREELIDISIKNGGSTRGDAKFDLDGATGTLAAYAALGKKLGSQHFLVDGEGLQLGRTARFWGQHVWVTRPGVAVHINAFNFPAWGQCEKMACALLAGVPVIEKVGEQTAWIAYEVAKVIVGSGLLPEGSYQFIAGGPGKLLEYLGASDCVAFTGSAKTGKLVRGHQSLIERGVRVTVEADSLNAHVLAPDVASDSGAYDQFLQNIVTDLSQKAGQKCTAVRRILVPKERLEDVLNDLKGQLERQKLGDPAEGETRIGALTDSRQLERAQSGIRHLAEKGRIVLGGPERARPKGAFLAPTLIVANDAQEARFHEVEVFAPVASVLPYDGSAASAIDLVNRGGGGLVCALYSNDDAWTESVVLGVAPWHGRVWIGSDRLAGQGLPPSLVLPQTVHGGPGRAGGGEELGGARGLEFYMQRTAIQGFQGFVQKRFGAPEAPAAGQ
jgi:oxepin-CoA hydrolase/3-oxo-5,6-dehydrosuberyl-CoA semialdehyde dehydrogenase